MSGEGVSNVSGVDPLIRVTVVRADESRFQALTQRRGRRIELLRADMPLPTLELGEELGLQRPVANDAMYVEPVFVADVTAGPSGTGVVLEPAGDRERKQQRDHVRVMLSSFTMELVEVPGPDAEQDDEPRRVEATVLDLSAGGARVEHRGSKMPVGSSWTVHCRLEFDDGATTDLEQPVEIRWSASQDLGIPAGEMDEEKIELMTNSAAGLRFTAMRPGIEERVTRWVFQQQAKLLRVRKQ